MNKMYVFAPLIFIGYIAHGMDYAKVPSETTIPHYKARALWHTLTGHRSSSFILLQQLQDAAGSNDIPAMQKLLNAGAPLILPRDIYLASELPPLDESPTMHPSINISGHFKATIYSPLHEAAKNGHLQALELLVNAGSPIDIYNSDPHIATPLIFAAQNGHANVVKFLLQHNADKTKQSFHAIEVSITSEYMRVHNYTNEGTAATLARKYGHHEIADFLENKISEEESA